MKTCLILIDIQNDYFPGGRMSLVGMEAAAANALMLLQAYRSSDSRIIHIQHISMGPNGTFFLPETRGAQTHKLVAPLEGEVLVTKNYPNAFRNTHLYEILNKEKISDIVFCGAMSHMCIDATVRAGFDLGFNCMVAEDACATLDLSFNDTTIQASAVHAAFMAALSGSYAKVLPTEEILQNSK
jgi:nicotinamidase-related amidase